MLRTRECAAAAANSTSHKAPHFLDVMNLFLLLTDNEKSFLGFDLKRGAITEDVYIFNVATQNGAVLDDGEII